ncbi:hypothetical protein BH09MYX1_BH09MYX1_03610 [soil metagenome]
MLNVPVLRQSFELVVERSPNITRRFYEILFERYPKVRPLFGSTDRLAAQEKMLTGALVAVLDHVDDAPWLRQTLLSLGAKHVSYGVRDEMYPWVGESLLATLAEVGGDDWTEEVATAWADAIGAIAGLMLEGARSMRDETESSRLDTLRSAVVPVPPSP